MSAAKKPQYNKLFYIVAFTTVVFIYGLLQYIISDRFKDFNKQQRLSATNSITTTSESISNYIIARRKLLSALTQTYHKELQQLFNDPSNTILYDDLLAKFRLIFPEIISITLANPLGATLSSIDPNFTLGKGCQVNIQLFKSGHLQQVFLHSNPNPDNYHFDILTHFNSKNHKNNIVFISVKTQGLEHILETGSQHSFQLVLIKQGGDPKTIEISPQGNRGLLQNKHLPYLLNSDEHLASQTVPGTSWILLADKNAATFEQYQNELTKQRNAVMLMALLAAVLVSFVFFRNDKKRLQAELATFNQNKILEKMVSERTQELSYQATHDSLTNLINRREFERRTQETLQLIHADYAEFVLMYLDLDQFKIINDTAGHAAGDQLLKEVASLLKSQLRKGDTLARLGGDEFGILLNHCDLARSQVIAEQLCSIIYNYSFEWEKHTFTFGVSIGIIEINDNTHDLSELLKFVDSACYIAKSQGRNRFYVYDPDDTVFQLHQQILSHSEIALTAIKDKHFELHGQKINAISTTQTLDWYEVLIRIKPENHLIFPDTFIPALEQSGNINILDNVVMHKAISYLALHPNLKLSVNLSPLTLLSQNFIKSVKQAFNQCEANPAHLCFEITETAAVQNLKPVKDFIKQIHKIGCSVALDDFGSGMSSFAYLKNLDVDYIKLDGAFVKDMHQEPVHSAMVDAMNTIAKAMNKFAIAEYVENQTIVDMLKHYGVAYGQGYHLHKPEKLDDILGS